jgi:hypothetical protein
MIKQRIEHWLGQMTSLYEHHAGLSGTSREPHGNGEPTEAGQELSLTGEPARLSSRTPLSGEDRQDLLGRRPTLGALVGWYAEQLQASRSRREGIDRHLLSLVGQPIARKVANTLTPEALVRHAQGRRELGIKPSTIGVDFSLIRTVLEAAKDANSISLDLDVVDRAKRLCKSDGLISSNAKAARRPTQSAAPSVAQIFSSAGRS